MKDKPDRTIYSQEFTPIELVDFIHEAWATYEANKPHKLQYGLPRERALYITRRPQLAAFFEGKCYEVEALDPSGRYLDNQAKRELFKRIADNIMEDKKLRQVVDELSRDL